VNIHLPSVTAFLKSMPFGRNRDQHLHLLGSAIALELTSEPSDSEKAIALYLGVLDVWPYAQRTWRPLLGNQWSQGEPPRGLQDVLVGLFYSGLSTTTPHNQSPKHPCRALDIVHVSYIDGTIGTGVAHSIDWTRVSNWRT
jgi:hypothetical protein